MSLSRLLAYSMIVTLIGVAGCQQRVYMTKDAHDSYKQLAMDLNENAVKPVDFQPADLQGLNITDVSKPEARKRPIRLSECIAIALENGRTGEFFPAGGGDARAIGLQGVARPSNTSDSIRVFAFDPAIQATTIEQSLSKFDARFNASMVWNKVDRPIGTALDTFQAFGSGLVGIQQDQAQLITSLVKPLPTGGLSTITFRTDYEFSNLSPRVNPSYRPALEFAMEQPLLQGAGVLINQIRNEPTGSLRQALEPGVANRVEGILITRLATEQSELEFNRRVQELLFQVERAYWDLYCAYWNLYSAEAGLRVTYQAWLTNKRNFDAGKIAEDKVLSVQDQYHQFRLQRLQALGNGGGGRPGVLEAERRLRYVLGLPLEDGHRLIPLDVPTLAPYKPDWRQALVDAMTNRPELVQTRLDIQAAQLILLRDKDLLLPDVRAFASYDLTAIGSHLDGEDDLSATRNFTQSDFNNWIIGLRGQWIIGKRGEHAQVQRTQLELAQRLVYLRDQEQKIAYALQRSYRDLVQLHKEIEIQRARRLSNENEMKIRVKRIVEGLDAPDNLDWRDAVRRWAGSLADEQFAICQYNIALAEFELQRGNMLEHDNVQILEGPMPACALGRASEHIRERDRAHILSRSPGDPCNIGEAPGELESIIPPASPEPGLLMRLFGKKHEQEVQVLPPSLVEPGNPPNQPAGKPIMPTLLPPAGDTPKP